MSDKEQYMPWNEGLPTGPDVALMQQTWPELKAGDRIEYAEVEKLLNITAGSNRWKSVTDAWRRREEEKGRVVICEPNAAFLVATAEQISARTYGVLQHIGRSAKRQRRHLATIRPETDLLRSTQEHQSRLMYAIEREAKKSRMNILPPAPAAAPEQPKIQPPKSASN